MASSAFVTYFFHLISIFLRVDSFGSAVEWLRVIHLLLPPPTFIIQTLSSFFFFFCMGV